MNKKTIAIICVLSFVFGLSLSYIFVNYLDLDNIYKPVQVWRLAGGGRTAW